MVGMNSGREGFLQQTTVRSLTLL